MRGARVGRPAKAGVTGHNGDGGVVGRAQKDSGGCSVSQRWPSSPGLRAAERHAELARPHGANARTIDTLFWPVLWIAAAVFVIVEGLIVYFLFKYRHRAGRDRIPPQIHGNTKLEVGWTILPALVLVGVAVPTVDHDLRARAASRRGAEV